MKDISVIVPVYNVEKYLSECIESILRQTYANYELLLINDGSTDNSLEICRYFEKKDKRVKDISKENGGLSDARNVGLDYASCEYVIFIDSDDYIADELFEVLYNEIKRVDGDVSICGYIRIDDEKKVITCDYPKYNSIYNNNNGMLELLKQGEIKTQAWAKLYRKRLFDNLRFDVGKYHEDVFIMHKIFGRVNRSITINRALYYYRYNPTSITNCTFKNKHQDLIYAELNRLNFVKDNYPEFEKIQLNALIWTCTNNNWKMIRSKTLNMYFKAFEYNTCIISKHYMEYILSDMSIKSKMMCTLSVVLVFVQKIIKGKR